jgi:adenylyl- and sulfurtransferase ThiI
MTSPQVEREVGGHIKAARGWAVDLDDAELTVHVELLSHEAFYFFGKERGPGGSHRNCRPRDVPALGGIDSPWRRTG